MKYEYAPERHHGVTQLMAVNGWQSPVGYLSDVHLGVAVFAASKLLGVKTTRAAIYGVAGYWLGKFLSGV